MKILYNPDCDLCFSTYGIEIPIVDDRAKKVFDKMNQTFGHLKIIENYDIPKINRDDLILAHNKEYVETLYSSYSSLEICILKAYELIDINGNFHRFHPEKATKDFSHAFSIVLKQVGLTYLAGLEALSEKFCYFLGGGMHHAMSFTGRGFCLVNDIAISIKKLQKLGKIKSAWIIDVDAHKGDGTAEIFKLDKDVHTLSIHMKEGWPLDSGSFKDPWFIPSSIELGIEINQEENYLKMLENGLLEMKNKFPLPDIVYVVNGADPYEYDELESAKLLKLSKDQMLKRDQLVYHFFKNLNIPQAYVMAGGYGNKSWEIYYQFLKFVWESSS